MRRYLILLAAVAMQLCLGATYAWSVFVQPLKEWTHLGQGPVQIPFSVFYLAFPATMIVSGTLLSRIGPSLCACGGGVIFGTGWFLAGLGATHFAFTVLGIGLLGGIGVGLAYIVPIAICIQWFPRHKGLVTGLAVAGFGGGAALVSQVAGLLMGVWGYTPFQTFQFLGVVFLLVVGFAGSTMRRPPGMQSRSSSLLPARAIISERAFRILYAAMLVGLAAGFAVNANLKELYLTQSVRAGVTAVSFFALANAIGRITWGWLFDRISSSCALQANLFLQAAVLFTSPLILRSGGGLQVFALLAGFNYGGVLVLYASSVARKWGADRVGQIYGWLFSANIPAALSPILAGYGYDALGTFTGPLWLIASMLVAAVWLVRKNHGVLKAEL